MREGHPTVNVNIYVENSKYESVCLLNEELILLI